MGVLRALRVPIGWKEVLARTGRDLATGNCLGLAAQLSYYFFLALFPALLFFVAIVSFIPIAGLLDVITHSLARVAPGEVITIITNQVTQIAQDKHGGLLTLGMLGTIWSTSSGVDAIISTLNAAYGVKETRSWWKVKARALALTVGLALFIVVAFALVVAGPEMAEKTAAAMHLGPVFEWTWKIVQWPFVFALVSLGVGMVYFYAPDAKQEWVFLVPGSVGAAVLWVLISLGFRFYVTHFGSYNATYGAIGGVIVLMLWFYVSSLAVLAGAELNAEIEHASVVGKDPGEKVPGENEEKMMAVAQTIRDAAETLPQAPAKPPRTRASDWILSGLVLGETALMTYVKVTSLLRRRRRSRS
jgi:membrane protein